jgi:hypothetical protein
LLAQANTLRQLNLQAATLAQLRLTQVFYQVIKVI